MKFYYTWKKVINNSFVVVKLLNCVQLFAAPWTAAHQASLSFSNSWSLLKLMSIELVMPFNHLILCHPLLLPLIFSASGSFPMSWLFASGGQSIGASIFGIISIIFNHWKESIFPMIIQGWFLLRLTGWISLQSKGPSRVFSSTIVWKHQFFSSQPSSWSNSHIHTWLLETP